MDGNRRTTVLGFVGAITVLVALFWLVGVDSILAALSTARLSVVALVVPVALVWLSAWGMALYTVLNALGTPISAPKAALVFAGAVFSNNVTPFGQAGGEPVSALLISRAADSEYETGLAAIASVDALHFLPSVGLATVGLGIFAVETVSLGRNLLIAAAAVGLLAAAIPVAAYLGWRYRYELEATVVRVFTPVVRAIARLIPGRTPPEAAAIEERIESFFEAIDRVAGSRSTLVAAVGFSLLGWLALGTSLWLSVYALGTTIPFAAVMIVIPVGSIAGFTPLPGGLGGIETAFVILLVSTTPVAAATASAAIVIHRGATYWLPTVIGGGVAVALGATHAQKQIEDE